jgi:hypothetical protein
MKNGSNRLLECLNEKSSPYIIYNDIFHNYDV